MAKTPDQYDKDQYDTHRGVRNSQVFHREVNDAPPEFDQSVQAGFEAKSVRGKLQKRYKKSKKELDDVLNASLDGVIEEEERNQQRLSGTVKKAAKGVATKTAQMVLRRLYMRALPYILLVLSIIYIFQLLCGLFSLVGFGLHAYIETARDGNLLEQAAYQIIDFVVNLEETAPAEAIGLIFWGMTTFYSVIIFILFQGWFQIIGINPFSTTISFIVTVVCLSLSLLPVTNLFPWMILWVLYMSISSVFHRE